MQELGLRPAEFWELTPGELALMVEGFRDRHRDEWFRVAWLASNVRHAVWAKKGFTPYELLGWQDPRDFRADLPLEEKFRLFRESMRKYWGSRGEEEQAH